CSTANSFFTRAESEEPAWRSSFLQISSTTNTAPALWITHSAGAVLPPVLTLLRPRYQMPPVATNNFPAPAAMGAIAAGSQELEKSRDCQFVHGVCTHESGQAETGGYSKSAKCPLMKRILSQRDIAREVLRRAI